MKTINSLSGGMTSATIAAMYPADYNLFALVTSQDPLVKYPDAKVRQIVSDKIGKEFIGTLEDDLIIYTMLELEQHIGKEITWVAGMPFEEVIARGGSENFKLRKIKYLPNVMSRFCTTAMKLEPMFNYWFYNISEVVEMRIGFRANEGRRVKKMVERMDPEGRISFKRAKSVNIKSKRNNWEEVPWQKPVFPLFDDGLYKQDVINFWKDKPVTFAPLNNCIGCFHRNPLLLNKMSNEHPNKFQWFINQEEQAGSHWRSDVPYLRIRDFDPQIELSFSDFEEDGCDSGHCGL